MGRCKSCDGTGESEKWDEPSGVMHDVPCFHCGGTGKIEEGKTMGEVEEFECNGCSGLIDTLVCPECGQEHDDPNEEPEDDYCVTCSGSGEGMYDGSTCRNCRGSGVEPRAFDDDREPPSARSRYDESADFNKFMDATLLKESRQATHDIKGVHPQRQVAMKYQERPLGRIKVQR